MIVWEFYKAPTPLQKLSPHGGDEDYLLLLEPGEQEPDWADRIGACGSVPRRLNTTGRHVSRHKLESGHTVLIGAHA